jgi:hypothetical protein
MIRYKAKGRPSKDAKDKVKRINEIIAEMPNSSASQYEKEVKNIDEIDDILSSLSSKKEKQEDMTKNTADDVIDFTEIKNDIGSSDEKDNDVPNFFNPLKESIHERNYNKIDTKDVGEIEEPVFGTQEQFENVEDVPPVFEVEEAEEVPKERVIDKITNESVNQLESGEKTMAVKQLVDMCLDGYELLHELAKQKVVFSEDKLKERIISGEIDPNDEIVVNANGDTSTPETFIQEYNEQAIESVSLDPKFTEKVREPMERVFAKKGWGMSDEQYLLVMFGKDITMKALSVAMLRKTVNGIMDTFAERNRIMKAEQYQSVSPQSPTTIDRPEPTDEPPSANSYEEDASNQQEPSTNE